MPSRTDQNDRYRYEIVARLASKLDSENTWVHTLYNISLRIQIRKYIRTRNSLEEKAVNARTTLSLPLCLPTNTGVGMTLRFQ